MMLWMSRLDERGRPKGSAARCVTCGDLLVRSGSNRRKYCDPCAKAAARRQSMEWQRLKGIAPGRLLD